MARLSVAALALSASAMALAPQQAPNLATRRSLGGFVGAAVLAAVHAWGMLGSTSTHADKQKHPDYPATAQPSLSAPDQLYLSLWQPCICFGLIAFFSACFRFPLTAVVILFELTGFAPSTWEMALPCVLASYVSITASDSLLSFPEYERRGGIPLLEFWYESAAPMRVKLR